MSTWNSEADETCGTPYNCCADLTKWIFTRLSCRATPTATSTGWTEFLRTPPRFSCGSQWNMPTPVVFKKFAGKKYYTNWMIIKLHDVYNSSIRTCLTYSIYLHVPYTKYPINVYRALQGILSFQSDHLDSSMNNTDTLRWKGLWISWVKFSRESKTLNESGVYGWTGSSCLEWNGITTL